MADEKARPAERLKIWTDFSCPTDHPLVTSFTRTARPSTGSLVLAGKEPPSPTPPQLPPARVAILASSLLNLQACAVVIRGIYRLGNVNERGPGLGGDDVLR
jgi:hypothetical protein